ncbi:uncharacterized protein TNCV_506901 [Trichonephila clavipes]|nr:uncharacterized protein TNCV_506901 [Trichonephila clavipes]
MTFHIDLAWHHCRSSYRCSGVKGSARKGRFDLRFASARCLETVCGTIATLTSARIVERVTKSADEAHRMLSNTFGEAAISKRTCRELFQLFKNDDFGVEDQHDIWWDQLGVVASRQRKAALTRTINFIDKNDQTFDKNDIRNKLEKLELTYTEFDKADAALPIESFEMEEFETKYYETKAKLQNILENLSVRTYVYNDNSDVFENVSNMKSSNFKLPKINIERFSGDYKDWPLFKDLYVSLVHDNMCLSNIQKFQYLRGLLLSEPANIIKHIPITETAYNEAWEKLLARYDKKKQIIFSLIKTFMEQPSFNDTNSHNLRNIADTSDEVIRGLKSIDSKAESRDVWLIYILLQKVDPKTRQEGAHF